MSTVLLIDDDEFENVVLTRLMANHVKHGFRVDYAKSVEDALAFLKTRKYDHVYLDDMLAENVNATTSVERIRLYLNGAPLVVISNDTNRDYLKDIETLRVNAVVAKNDLPEYIYASVA